MRKTTIKDVAKAANVSISTVSNALNNVDVVTPETKAMIQDVARQLNYIPNLNGKNLKATATKVIGLFLTSMKGPYYGALTDAIYDTCNNLGYELNIFVTENTQNMLANMLGKRIDGAIILNEWIDDAAMLILQDAHCPTIFLDREICEGNMGSVVFDSYKCGYDVAQYLIELGHKRIGFIKGFDYIYDSRERFRGFLDCIKANGGTFQTTDLLDGQFNEQIAKMAVNQFINENETYPTAFFAANDLSGIGCIKALLENGFNVPGDMSVVGCDDIPISEWFRPSLTTVNNPIYTQGAQAVQQLVAIIQGNEINEVIRLTGRLVERDSTKKIETL